MASVSTSANGTRKIQQTLPNGKRATLYVGRMGKAVARDLADLIERLATAAKYGQNVDARDKAALEQLTDECYGKLVEWGLCPPRKAAVTVAQLIADYRASLTVKAGTLAAYKQGLDDFEAYVGGSTKLADIDARLVEQWKTSMRGRVAPATAAKRMRTVKNLMRKAVRWRLIPHSPCDGIAAGSQSNPARQFFVTPEVATKVMESITDPDLKLAFVLARWLGVRVPSELAGLTWGDVLWEQGKVRIKSPKTAHHEGADHRFAPLFPEVAKALQDAFDAAPEGATYVFGERLRSRGATVNLRTALRRGIERAGLRPWPRLWQNLRASRATELAREYPGHVAASWLGHCAAVAQSHYWMVGDADFAKAVKGVSATASEATQNPTHQVAEVGGNVGKMAKAENENPPENVSFPRELSISASESMGPIGFEPTTSSLSGTRSNQLSYEPGVPGWTAAATGTSR